MSWKEILKMMTPRGFMNGIINHIGGGEIKDESAKTRGRGRTYREIVKMTVKYNNRQYQILYDSRPQLNPEGVYVFNYQESSGSGKIITIKGYSLKQMLETFKQQWKEDSNIENVAPLAAALTGTAIQTGKTLAENMEKGEKEIESELEIQEEEEEARKDVEKLGPLAVARVASMSSSDEEKLNFRVKNLSSGDGYKNSVKSRDGGTKPTPVPSDANSSINRLRKKPQ